MLNPLLRCGVHITEMLTTPDGRRLNKAAARGEAVRRLAEVGIHDPGVADRYPFELRAACGSASVWPPPWRATRNS